MINTNNIRLLMQAGYMMVLILLIGCEFIPTLPSSDAVTIEPDYAGEHKVVAVILLEPSPYQQNTKSVDKLTRQQFEAVKVLMRKKQWPQAELALQLLIAQAPQLSGPSLNLAIVYEQLNKPQQAELYYQQALKINPLNTHAYNLYGVYLRKLGRFIEAEQQYQQALSVWPQDMDSYRNLGILYDLYMGHLGKALSHYQQYLLLVEAAYTTEQLQQDKDYRQLKGWTLDLKRRLSKEQ